MSGFEWFLLVVVVIVVPLVVAVVVTLWTLEQARQRKKSNRESVASPTGEPVKRKATRDADATGVAATAVVAGPLLQRDDLDSTPGSQSGTDSTPPTGDSGSSSSDSGSSSSDSGSSGSSE